MTLVLCTLVLTLALAVWRVRCWLRSPLTDYDDRCAAIDRDLDMPKAAAQAADRAA